MVPYRPGFKSISPGFNWIPKDSRLMKLKEIKRALKIIATVATVALLVIEELEKADLSLTRKEVRD